MKSGTRIKAVAFALTVVFLASITVAGFASAASSNAAAGVYLTFAMSRNEYGWTGNIGTSWTRVVSITVPNVGYSAWWKVECDGYAYVKNCLLGIAIGVNSMSPDMTTYRFYGDITEANTDLKTGVHTEEMYYLGAGAHTFYFLAHRELGAGPTNQLAYNKITVTFFTDAYVSTVAGGEVSANPDMP